MKSIVNKSLLTGIVLFGIACSTPQNEVVELQEISEPPEVRENHRVPPSKPIETVFDNYEIDKPISHKGLQVFLISGPSEIKNSTYTTLDQAMKTEVVTVNETGNVGELSIKNNGNKPVYIHSGDIVKGGKQDRTIAHDMVIPPNSKTIPLKSFCVEQSRWRQRGSEDVSKFSGNSRMLSSKELRYAAKYKGNQSDVWSNVSKEQSKLNRNISKLRGKNVDVKQNESASSLQLTLENEELKKVKSGMKEKFDSLLTRDEKTIGYAYAINGKVYGVEMFNNKKLLKDLWGKLSHSIMDEAVANYDTSSTNYKELNQEDVIAFINATKSNEVKESEKGINQSTQLITQETKTDVLFSTIDLDKEKWLHKSYMEKDTTLAQNNTPLNMNRRIIYTN